MSLRFKAISIIRGAYKNMKKRFGSQTRHRLHNQLRQYVTYSAANID